MLAWLVLLLRCLTGSESHALLDSFAWEVFEEAGVLDLELEAAACLTPQLSVHSRNRDSYFMEDLGVASGSFGRLISQMMSKPSLQKSDLQMLLEHPTVRSIAALLSLQSAESDSEGEDIPEELNTFQDSLAWEVFEEAGISDLELEIAACLAQLSADSWNRDSHFTEDLGVDSVGFGRLISQARSESSLQEIDLQMLFEHPTDEVIPGGLNTWQDPLACEVFEDAGVSDPELEITACLAPQLSVDSWHPDSHFLEDLGADSEDFGRMISQTRSNPSLRKIDLQMLSEHPTIRSLAACFSLQSAESDSEDEDTPEKLLAWKVFAEAGVSDPELEIAVCLAPQLSVDSLNPDSHFMEDLGADSEDFGRMISQTRLQEIDLQILSEHPTVRSLAACFPCDQHSQTPRMRIR